MLSLIKVIFNVIVKKKNVFEFKFKKCLFCGILFQLRHNGYDKRPRKKLNGENFPYSLPPTANVLGAEDVNGALIVATL